MPRSNLLQRVRLESINQVVSLHPQSFSSTHLYEWFGPVLRGQLNPEFITSSWGERHHFVGEVDARILAAFRNQCGDAARDNLLRIRLPGVNYVVYSHSTAKIGARNFRSDFTIWFSRGYPGNKSVFRD